MRRLMVVCLLAGLSLSASAVPNVDAVQAEVAKGNYARAEEMMREVVAARPGSARAHYVYAEILAHDRRFDLAAEQAARAKAIDPELHFTEPEKYRAFERLLEREQTAARRPAGAERAAAPVLREAAPVERSSVIPGWAWGLGLAALGLLAWRIFGARRQGLAGASPMGTPLAAPGMPIGGYGAPYAAAPAPGSGLLGTGLAVAGGVAAGMLAERLLEGGHQAGSSGGLFPAAASGLGAGPYDGRDEAAAARDLEERPVDFGSGDGWGGGDAGDGGSSDDGGW